MVRCGDKNKGMEKLPGTLKEDFREESRSQNPKGSSPGGSGKGEKAYSECNMCQGMSIHIVLWEIWMVGLAPMLNPHGWVARDIIGKVGGPDQGRPQRGLDTLWGGMSPEGSGDGLTQGFKARDMKFVLLKALKSPGFKSQNAWVPMSSLPQHCLCEFGQIIIPSSASISSCFTVGMTRGSTS